MNIYDRMINILLEARIEDYLDRLDERNKGNRAKVKAWQATKDRTPHVKKSPEDKLAAGRRALNRGPGQRTPSQVSTDDQIARSQKATYDRKRPKP